MRNLLDIGIIPMGNQLSIKKNNSIEINDDGGGQWVTPNKMKIPKIKIIL